MNLANKNNTHPLTNSLRLLRLDKHYFRGFGDYLYYKEDETSGEIEVLDLTGGYGVHLLGYNHKMLNSLLDNSKSEVPNFVQLSYLPEREVLENLLIERIVEHTQFNNWFCEFANSGSEIIETAIKIAWLDFQKRKACVIQELNAVIHHLNYQEAVDEVWLNKVHAVLISVKESGFFAFIEGAFHGKTLGALSLIGNSDVKSLFPTALPNVAMPRDGCNYDEFIEQYAITYYTFDERKSVIVPKQFLPLAGVFLEPIQGEAGVIALPEKLLLTLKMIQHNFKVTIVSDEIQCGLYRTGSFSALNPALIKADIYCFGKQLGAGIAKIAALCCKDSVYTKELFEVNTSTFGADAHSFRAAIAFFEVVASASDARKCVQQQILRRALLQLQAAFPAFISSVRGSGHMLAIELNERMVHHSYLTKFFKDIGKLGYWIASVLLNRTAMRVFPSLSAPLTFRCQPSLYFSEKEIGLMIKAWTQFFEAIQRNDLVYLFGHIIPFTTLGDTRLKPFPEALYSQAILEGAAVFLCHPIDALHAGAIVDLIDYFGADGVGNLLQELSFLQEFTVYHKDKLSDVKGNSIDVVFLGVPMTSLNLFNTIKRNERHVWVQKIQRAIDLANVCKARVVGLGQFTSILSKNGTLLQSPNTLLTTGNAYTAHLTIEAVRQEVIAQGKFMNQLNVCIVGAKGNIMSVTAAIIAKEVRRLVLVFRNPLVFENDTYHSVKSLLQNLLFSNAHHFMVAAIRKVAEQFEPDCIDWMELIASAEDVLVVTDSIEHKSVLASDIVFMGTNDTHVLLKKEHISSGCIIADVSVPGNTDVEVINSADFVFVKGGIAGLPIVQGKEQELKSVILPFGSGECYACMAETFGIAFNKAWHRNNIGNIEEGMVNEVASMLKETGFYLKRSKVDNSI